MILPKPGPAYDANNEAQTRDAIRREDDNNQKRNRDIVIENRRFILVSPDGTRWSGTIDDLGAVTWTAL